MADYDLIPGIEKDEVASGEQHAEKPYQDYIQMYNLTGYEKRIDSSTPQNIKRRQDIAIRRQSLETILETFSSQKSEICRKVEL